MYDCVSLLEYLMTVPMLKCVAVSVSLQHTAIYCNPLQHNATYCHTLQRTEIHSLHLSGLGFGVGRLLSLSLSLSVCIVMLLLWLVLEAFLSQQTPIVRKVTVMLHPALAMPFS